MTTNTYAFVICLRMPKRVFTMPLRRQAATVAAAKWVAEDRLSQKEVASRLGLSQPGVSRMLKEAKKQRFYEDRPTFNPTNVPSRLLAEAEQTYFSTERLETLIPKSTRVKVCGGSTPEEFFDSVAFYLCELLKESTAVGLMFGRTTRVLLNSFQKLAPMLQIRTHLKNLRFLPLSCDPVYIMNSGEEQHTIVERGSGVYPKQISREW